MQKLLFFLLLLSSTVSAQVLSNKVDPIIQNSKTGKHVNIPGTRLYIIPPPGFTIGSGFVGLQKGGTAMINIMDLVGGNFYSNAGTFNKTAFEQGGARVFDYREIRVNGYPAKFLHLQGDPTAKGYALVFGDSSFSTMVMAAYPVNDEITANQIVAAMNSIYYDKNRKIDPFETAFFSLDDTGLKFKFAKYTAGLYMYSEGGLDNFTGTDNPVVLITPLPIDNTMTAKTVADGMLTKAQQYGLTNPEIRNISQETINGYAAYEAEVYGLMEGKISLIYQCVLIKGDKALVVQGVARSAIETSLPDFKKLARMVRIR